MERHLLVMRAGCRRSTRRLRWSIAPAVGLEKAGRSARKPFAQHNRGEMRTTDGAVVRRPFLDPVLGLSSRLQVPGPNLRYPCSRQVLVLAQEQVSSFRESEQDEVLPAPCDADSPGALRAPDQSTMPVKVASSHSALPHQKS